MNQNSRETRRLNIKSFFLSTLPPLLLKAVAFCNLVSERLPALSIICLFGCLACVEAFVCRLSKHFSAVHSVDIFCAGDILLLLKLLLKFRNVLKHTESRNSLACNQNIKTSPQIYPQRWRFSLTLKRNYILYK